MPGFIGQSLGRYQIVEQLGEGGMATVYKAYDTRLEADVAVKVIRTEELSPKVLERALKRFEREAKALAKLTHANIVKVIDYGEYEGRPYLVMPYLSGGTLKQRLTGTPVPWQQAVKVLVPVARALDYAHRQGMIHRDVKPSNILITDDGDPLLTDFGIAKIIDDEATLDLTGTSATVGTPEYMAPEQVTSKTVDHRADIYALGVVFYEMVTGRKLYTADTPMAVLVKHATEPLPRPTQYAPDLPPQAEQVLLKALAKKPEERYQSMLEFANSLDCLVSSTMSLPQVSGATVKQKDGQRGKVRNKLDWRFSARFLAIGVVILIGVAGILLGRNYLVASIRIPEPTSFLPSATYAILPSTKTADPPTKTAIPPTSITQLTTMVETPVLGIGSTRRRQADGMTLVYVPAGEFMMGSDTGILEKPAHTVYVDAFWMDQTEVTNAMYDLCVRSGICQIPRTTASPTRTSYYGNSNYDDYPVIYVVWADANSYCEWAGAHLPTEAEWEKAARGTDGRTYPWGNDPPSSDRVNSGAGEDTVEVGSYPMGASPYDALDMAGNVNEWVADWFSYYPSSPVSNPSGPELGNARVCRGGGYWRSIPHSSYRYQEHPDVAFSSVGFRCAMSATP